MKQLISKYIEESYSVSLKDLAVIKAYQSYNGNEGRFKDEFNLDRADLLEELEKDLLLHRGYSITTKQELNDTIAYVLDGLIEEYSKSILDNLNKL